MPNLTAFVSLGILTEGIKLHKLPEPVRDMDQLEIQSLKLLSYKDNLNCSNL